MEQSIVPVGTEIECYPDWLSEGNEMPVYTGDPESAHVDLVPGIYPGSYVKVTDQPGTDGPRMEQVNVLLVVTSEESFAVTTTQSYTGPRYLEEEAGDQ